MFAVIRYLLLAVLMLSGYAAKADTGGYKVYSDSAGNIYLEAPRQFVLVHSEVSIPLLVTPKNGLLKLTKSGGVWQITVLTQAQWQSLQLTSGSALVESISYDDFDGDGSKDIRLTFTNQQPPIAVTNLNTVAKIIPQLPVSTVDSANSPHIQSVVTDTAIIGGTSGAFRVDESGAATYSIPFPLPAGIAGNTPDLSLNYHSQAGNGPAGIGWAVNGLSSIARCRQTPVQDGAFKAITLTNSDRLCLDGQRLVVIEGSYGAVNSVYATEIDSQVKVTALGELFGGPKYFEVRRADGSISYYGKSADSRFVTKSGPVISWGISEVTDLIGSQTNKIHYNYGSAGNEQLLLSVTYSGNQVSFEYDYAERTDRVKTFVFDREVTPSALLTGVTVKNHNAVTTYSMKLTHDTAPLSGLKRVRTVTECGVGGRCLKPLNINWNESAENKAGFKTSAAVSRTVSTAEQIVFSQPADMTGDGRLDWVYVTKNNKTHTVYVMPGTGSGLSAAQKLFSFSVDRAEVMPRDMEVVKLVSIRGHSQADILYFETSQSNSGQKYAGWNARSIQSNDSILTTEHLGRLVTVGYRGGHTEHASIALHDFNGDGLPDLLTHDGIRYNTSRDTGGIYYNPRMFGDLNNVCYRKPGTTTPINSQCGTSRMNFSSALDVSQSYDLNGDGLNDLVIEASEQAVYLPNTYWAVFDSQINEANQLEFMLRDTLGGENTIGNDLKKLFVIDMNNDGQSDYLYHDYQRWYISYNSQTKTKAATVGLSLQLPKPDDMHFMQFMDLTGNGVNDIAYYHNGWKMLSYPFTGNPVSITGPSINTSNENAQFVDMRGNGKPALVVTNFVDKKIRWFDFGAQTVSYPPCHPNCPPPCAPSNGEPCREIQSFNVQSASVTPSNTAVSNALQDKVSVITTGHELKTKISYGFLNDTTLQDEFGYASGLNIEPGSQIFTIKGAVPLVSKIISDTGQGSVGIAYKYGEARIQSGGRGSLGFSSLSTLDLQTNIKTRTRYKQGFPYIGMPFKTEQWAGDKLLSTSFNTYEQLSLHNKKTVFPYLKRAYEEQSQLNSDGSHTLVSKVLTEQNYTTVSDRYVQLSEMNVYTSDEVYNRIRWVRTVNSYTQDNLARWIVNRLTHSAVTHQEGKGSISSSVATITPDVASVVRASEFNYYSNGMLKEEIVEPQGDEQSYLKTSYTYDAVGNTKTKTLNSKVGATPLFRIARESEYVYDGDSRYLTAKKVNGETVASYSSFNALGQAQTVTENGIRSILRYNGFGQPVFSREQTPAGLVSGRYSIITRGYTAAAVGLPAVGMTGYSYERVQQGGAPTQWKVVDAAGRDLASITEAFENGRYVVNRKEYDVMGRPRFVSQPAFDNGMVIFSSSGYDSLGRPQLMEAADGTRTHISYSGLSVTSEVSNFWSGAAAQRKTEYKDAFGQLRSVTDAAGSLSYSYDVTGNLRVVTGVDGKAMVMTYNSRGQKQTMVDPDSGNWSYRYNAVGELVEQTNPANHVTTTWYDNFGRKVKEESSGHTTQWGYSDESGHPVRNLVVSEVNTNGPNSTERHFDYDDLGRLTHSELRIDGEVLTERTTYDEYSRVFQVFDASGNDFGMQYEYQRGYKKAVWEARYGVGKANSVRYQHILATDAYGNVTESRAGNGRTTWRTHDDITGMLKSITTQGGLQALTYTFDGLGNLRSRSDQNHRLLALNGGSPAALNESFDYDNLNRLTHVRNNGTVTQSLSYFANGNIKTKSDVQSGAVYQYGTKPSQCGRNSGPRAVSQIGTTGYCYDAAGNQTHQYNNGALVRQVDYNPIGKPARIRSFSTDTASGSSPGDSLFTYDGSRNLVKRHVTEQGSTKTYYQHGGVELIKEGNSTTVRRNLGNALVERSGQKVTTRYVYTDHLGSVDVITNAAGVIEQKLSFDAFGKRRQVFTAAYKPVALTLSAILNLTNRGYTGHLQVDHASIVHMDGRIYDAHIGRFLQADPFVQAPTNSQNHNRYSYVLNNPLSYTDPSGYFFSKLWKEIKPFIGVIVAVVGSVVCPACSPMLIGAIAGATSAAVNGGNILQGAAMGAFSGMAFGVVGETWPAGTFGNILGNAAVGGWMNSIQGGKFGHGFFAAGFSAAFKSGINEIGNKAASHTAHRIVAAAVVGGTASKISGGKFANGAVTGAFSQAFNGERALRKMSLWDRVERDYSHEFLSDFESKNPYEYELFKAYTGAIDATLWTDGEIGHLMEANSLLGFEAFAVEKATLLWAGQIQAQGEGAIPGAIKGAAQDRIFKTLGAPQLLSKSVSNGQFVYSNSDLLRYTPEAIAISTSRSTSVINRNFVKEIYGK